VIPGKNYLPEDLLRLAWRHRRVVLVALVLATVAASIASISIRDRYRSETLILVVPQQVPESYVRSTVTLRIEDRLQAISQQVLSRTSLAQIIQDFDLYPGQRRTGTMEEVVDRMRKDIDVQFVKGDAFRVSYTGTEAATVMHVTERIASLFINGSLRDREALAEGTDQFLETQLNEARQRLIEHEKKLEEFRRRYDGQLPSQVESNLQVIRSTELQLQALTESLNRDRDQKVLLERQLQDAGISDLVMSTGSVPAGAADVPAAQQLDLARAELGKLQQRFTPEHPDVIRARRRVSELERQLAAQGVQGTMPDRAALNPVDRARQNRVLELHAQLDNLDNDVKFKQAEEKRLLAAISDSQAKVAAAPTRESELVELTRDYDTLQKTYASLLAKHEDAQIAANLERRQIGEQFRVLDPAHMPEKPYSPNRPLIVGVGALGGLGVGLALVALLEYRDTSLRSPADVLVALALPVLASVPVIVTAAEQRTRKRTLWLVSAATLIMACATALLLWKLRT
jgi:polysaccharide chain length determinant protein (PEP-CTERM system associated)